MGVIDFTDMQKSICGWKGSDRMGVIDFTDMQKRNKAYAGANGKKISVLYDGEQYMLKFPSMVKKNPDMS